MGNNYTLGFVSDLRSLSDFDVCQLSLNPAYKIPKGSASKALKFLCAAFPNTKILVHLDMAISVSKWPLYQRWFTKDTLRVMEELNEVTYSNFVGVVAHTTQSFTVSRSKIYVPDAKDLIMYKGYRSLLVSGIKSIALVVNYPVFLETPASHRFNGSSLDMLSLAIEESGQNHKIGVCIDTEHVYAADGLSLEDVTKFLKTTDLKCVVHLNAVPSGVKPLSRKDRHSTTTLQECSVNNLKQYLDFTELLDSLGVVYVREVNKETRLREYKQIWQNK